MGNTVPFDVSAPLLSPFLLLCIEMGCPVAPSEKATFLMPQTGDYELL